MNKKGQKRLSELRIKRKQQTFAKLNYWRRIKRERV